MLGLTVQNFVSAGTGMAVLVALIRGIVRHTAQSIGSFWVDLTRSVLYILLPLALLFSIVLVSQGVVQTVDNYQTVNLLQPTRIATGSGSQARSWLSVQRLLRLRSSSLERMAEGFSTPTQLIHLRIPRRFQLPRDAGDPANPGVAMLYVRRDGRRYAPGLGITGSHDHHLARLSCRLHLGGVEGKSRPFQLRSEPTSERSPTRRQYGRKRSPLRDCINSAMWAT